MMKFKRSLVRGLIGLAIFAVPISAAAGDNDRGRNGSHQSQAQQHGSAAPSRSFSAPEHFNAPARNFAPAPRNEFRDQRSFRAENRAPEVADHPDSREDRNQARRDFREDRKEAGRDFREDRKEARRDWRVDRNERDLWDRDRDRDHRDYRDREDRDYRDREDDDDYSFGAPYYVMPRGYGPCGWARHLRNVYWHDRNTGHPAAAADLLSQLHRAERKCGGVPYGYNGYRYLPY